MSDKDMAKRRRTSLLQKDSADLEVPRPVQPVCNILTNHLEDAFLIAKMREEYFRTKEKPKDTLTASRFPFASTAPDKSLLATTLQHQQSPEASHPASLASIFKRIKKTAQLSDSQRYTFETFTRDSTDPFFCCFLQRIPDVVGVLYCPITQRAPSFFKYLTMRYPPNWENTNSRRSTSNDRPVGPYNPTTHREIVYQEFVKYIIGNFQKESEGCLVTLIGSHHKRLDEFIRINMVDGQLSFDSPNIPFESSVVEQKKTSVAFSKSPHLSQVALLAKSSSAFHRRKQAGRLGMSQTVSKKTFGWTIERVKEKLKEESKAPPMSTAPIKKIADSKKTASGPLSLSKKTNGEPALDLTKSRVSTIPQELIMAKQTAAPTPVFEVHATNQKIANLMGKTLKATFVTGERMPGMR